MKFERHFTGHDADVFGSVEWNKRDVTIRNEKGNTIFSMKDVEAPVFWSDLAVQIAAEKYFVKVNNAETSVRQLVWRVASAITGAGIKQGYFDNDLDAVVFEDELTYILIHQLGAFNSPVWFNVGRYEGYRLDGGPGNFHWDTQTQQAIPTKNSYKRPQASACFILGVEDSLDGLFEHFKTEARIFKRGSGAGANYSGVREEGAPLSNGGVSSGVMSFLNVGDAGAGATKSGGTTRRAARMVCMDVSHPDIGKLIDWKANEENKAECLIKGGYSGGMGGEAYSTVGGQNANNSVRVTDEFMEAVEQDRDWGLVGFGGRVKEMVKAKALWRRIAVATHRCGDPGLHFDTTQNKWHTVPTIGRIRATNPCSEYLHLDDSACNLASIRLTKFLSEDATVDRYNAFDTDSFAYVTRLFIVAQDILVDYSSYPTAKIVENSHKSRPLGLGYADLGTLLTYLGLAYDTEIGRDYAASITALMTGVAYRTSAEIAEHLGAFEYFEDNKAPMRRVLDEHEACLQRLSDNSIAEAAENYWDHIRNASVFRNSQVTLLAPTGTIGFLMDAATTGVEPEFALVKHKRLAGGGVVKIINPTVEKALMRLGHTRTDTLALQSYMLEHGRLTDCPQLTETHRKVFACANDIPWDGHIRMMAAVQPFLSGAISKTVNMPATTTVEDIEAAYMLSWKLGLKAVALYRDGCKQGQPLTTEKKSDDPVIPVSLSEKSAPVPAATALPTVSSHRPLPHKRRGTTFKAKLAGHTFYIRTGEYPTGEVGELFVETSKEGSTFGSLMDAFAKAVSIGIQYGVPLKKYIKAFTNTQFEPSGMVHNHPTIKRASSPIDLVMRVLGVEIGMTELQHVQPEEGAEGVVNRPVVNTTANSDAPLCDNCGSMTIRNGACHRCPNCGSSLGCS